MVCMYICIYIYIIYIYVYFFRRTILIHHWILYEWCVQWPTWRFNRSVFQPVPDVGHGTFWDHHGSPTFVSIHGMFEGFWDQQHDVTCLRDFGTNNMMIWDVWGILFAASMPFALFHMGISAAIGGFFPVLSGLGALVFPGSPKRVGGSRVGNWT